MAGTSYTRQSTIADGNIITAALFNNEFNQILNAFAYASTGTTGHQHDGGAGEGGNIAKIGDQDFLNKIEVDSTNNRIGLFVQVSSGTVEQVRIQDGAIVPVTDSDVDLGTNSVRFKDAYLDTVSTADITSTGTANIVTGVVTGDLTLTGADYDIVFDASASELKFNDNAELLIGTGNDLKIYHDGSNTRIREQGTGNLLITADSQLIMGSSNGAASFVVEGAAGTTFLAGGTQKMFIDSGGVNFPDNVKLNIGNSDDLQIYHDGYNSVINDTGTGSLILVAFDQILMTQTTGTGSFPVAEFGISTGCELFHNTSKKFNTTSTGVAIGGNAAITGAATAQAFTAAAQMSTPTLQVTTLKASDGSAAGSIANSTGVVTLASSVLTTTDINGGTIDGVTIGANSVAGNLSFADNAKAIFGNDGNELALYHNTTDSIIEDQGTGSLLIKGTQLKLQSADGEDYATFTNNGPARLFNNGVEKFATSSTGATVTGRLNTGQIEVTTLRANDGTAAGSIADSTGVTTLNSAVLTTADINGGTVDGTVIGGSTAAAGTFTTIGSGDITITDGTPSLTFVDSDGANQKTEQLQAGGSFVTTVRNNDSHGSIDFKSTNGSTNKLRLRIGTNGDFNHYLDDGTTLGMKFDASAGRLGIGSNTSPGAALDVEGNVLVRHFNPSLTLNDTDGDQECVISCNGNAAFITSTADNGAYGEIAFRRSDGSTTKNFVRFEDNGHVNFFKDDGGNAMRLTGNAGSLGIGVTSPTEKLHVSGNIKAEGIVFDTETQGTGTSVASNTLEDYERGTFTPTLYDKNATDGNQAVVGTPVGSYTKVGDLVHCTINLSNINVSANSMVSGQQLHIHGLPFTSTTSRLVPIPVYTVQFDVGSPIVGVFGIFGGNGNFIQLRTVFEGGGTAALDVSSVNSTSADLHVAFTYQTSE